MHGYYELKFKVACMEAKGAAFQELFERLMKEAYGEDFEAVIPWGRSGDQKCDGRLRSREQIFQVYAPNEVEVAKTLKKIDEDFEGAKLYWPTMKEWTFVYNAEGLPPDVVQALALKGRENPGIHIRSWGFHELRSQFAQVSNPNRALWFGPLSSAQDLAALSFKELEPLLRKLAATSAPENVPIKPVPLGKIEANALSPTIKDLLEMGMRKTVLVQEFLQKYHDASLGEALAQRFHQAYREHEQSYRGDPDIVFLKLQDWVQATGPTDLPPVYLCAASLAVLAYFFESCDIFEAPRSP